MKRKIWVVSFLLAFVCACLCFVGCDKKDEQKTVECSVISSTQTQVVISVTSLMGEWTLEECMEKLSTEGQAKDSQAVARQAKDSQAVARHDPKQI